MAQDTTKETLHIINIIDILKNPGDDKDPLLNVLTKEKQIKSIRYSEFTTIASKDDNYQKRLNDFIHEQDGIKDENELMQLHQDVLDPAKYHPFIKLIVHIFINGLPSDKFPVAIIDKFVMQSILACPIESLMGLIENQRTLSFAWNVQSLDALNVSYIFYINIYHHIFQYILYAH